MNNLLKDPTEKIFADLPKVEIDQKKRDEAIKEIDDSLAHFNNSNRFFRGPHGSMVQY